MSTRPAASRCTGPRTASSRSGCHWSVPSRRSPRSSRRHHRAVAVELLRARLRASPRPGRPPPARLSRRCATSRRGPVLVFARSTASRPRATRPTIPARAWREVSSKAFAPRRATASSDLPSGCRRAGRGIPGCRPRGGSDLLPARPHAVASARRAPKARRRSAWQGIADILLCSRGADTVSSPDARARLGRIGSPGRGRRRRLDRFPPAIGGDPAEERRRRRPEAAARPAEPATRGFGLRRGRRADAARAPRSRSGEEPVGLRSRLPRVRSARVLPLQGRPRPRLREPERHRRLPRPHVRGRLPRGLRPTPKEARPLRGRHGRLAHGRRLREPADVLRVASKRTASSATPARRIEVRHRRHGLPRSTTTWSLERHLELAPDAFIVAFYGATTPRRDQALALLPSHGAAAALARVLEQALERAGALERPRRQRVQRAALLPVQPRRDRGRAPRRGGDLRGDRPRLPRARDPPRLRPHPATSSWHAETARALPEDPEGARAHGRRLRCSTDSPTP